jgi:hypothetical protein
VRLKRDVAHRVPLCPRGRDRARADRGGKAGRLFALGHGEITVHGFRSTFKDWAYRRGDGCKLRQQLMDAWGRFCDPDGPSNVVPLIARRRLKIHMITHAP